MQLSDPEAKEQLLRRLRRIEGQLRGVQAMLTDERDCREILQQLTSIRSAVQGASQAFIEEYATRCLLSEQANDRTLREQLLKDMLIVLSKSD
jgi:DNA-binding FrmR family transcriptional regulator